MRVRVKLFAAARELAGQDTVTLDVTSGGTVADVRKALETTNPELCRIIPHSLWAVDTQYAVQSQHVSEQSEIALIPPVSGG
jgi:molybdopterin converting factor subunit 1